MSLIIEPSILYHVTGPGENKNSKMWSQYEWHMALPAAAQHPAPTANHCQIRSSINAIIHDAKKVPTVVLCTVYTVVRTAHGPMNLMGLTLTSHDSTHPRASRERILRQLQYVLYIHSTVLDCTHTQGYSLVNTTCTQTS